MISDAYLARIYIAQARAFRRHPGFHATLMTWAAERRRRAAQAAVKNKQLELFT